MFFLIFCCATITEAQIKKQKKSIPQVVYNNNVNAPLTEKERQQIIEAYGDYAERLVFQSPERLRVFKNILRNRVKIYKHNKKDLSKLIKLSSVKKRVNNGLNEVFSPEKFNPLVYEFDFFSKNTTHKTFWVDHTKYTITILPQLN